MKRTIVVPLALVAALATVAPAGATPLISLQAGMRCDVCHVNPTGGLLRTEVGRGYGVTALPWSTELGPELAKGAGLLTENPLLSVGGDFRALGIVTGQEGKRNPNLFPMQGDLYVTSRLAEHLSLLGQAGLERGGNAAVREVFAKVDRLPLDGYVKFGKFIPPYGHRLDDHTAYVRKELFVDQSNPVSYDAGVEAGARARGLYAQAAAFNEDLTPASGTDKMLRGYSAVAGWHGSWLQLGGSLLHVVNNQAWGEAISGDAFGDRTAYGGYGGVSVRPVTWLFEVDGVQNEPNGVKDAPDELITFNEVTVAVHRGLNVRARYETLDPDRDRGGDTSKRFVAAVDCFPFPFLEISLQYRHNDTPDENYDQGLLMAHLWF